MLAQIFKINANPTSEGDLKKNKPMVDNAPSAQKNLRNESLLPRLPAIDENTGERNTKIKNDSVSE